MGPHTAAAVASIAFDEPIAAVDGNVIRVAARLACVRDGGDATKPFGRRAVRVVAAVLDRDDRGIITGDDGIGRDGVRAQKSRLRGVSRARSLRRARAAPRHRVRRRAVRRRDVAREGEEGGAARRSRRRRRRRGDATRRRRLRVSPRAATRGGTPRRFVGVSVRRHAPRGRGRGRESGGGARRSSTRFACPDCDARPRRGRRAPVRGGGDARLLARQTEHRRVARARGGGGAGGGGRRARGVGGGERRGGGREWRWVSADDVAGAGLSSGPVKVHALVTGKKGTKEERRRERRRRSRRAPSGRCSPRRREGRRRRSREASRARRGTRRLDTP